MALLERVVTRLGDECAAENKAIPYAKAAQSLKMDEAAVRVAVHRLRKRYRELLRDEIAQTLDDPA